MYEGLARGVAHYLRGIDRRTTVYARSSLGAGEPVYGVSDIDLAVVLPAEDAGHARLRVRRRWERLTRALPLFSELALEPPRVYSEASLREAGTPALTYGLEARNGARPSALYFGEESDEERIRIHERPGLFGPTSDWRLLVGPERRPRERDGDAQLRRLAAWLELQFWWRQAFEACMDPRGPRKPYLCVKLVAEPARIWLWLAEGERVWSRREALLRAARRMPEEEAAFRLGLELLDALPEAPRPPFEQVIPACVRLSSSIARLIDDAAQQAGVRPVRIDWGDEAELVLPKGGWTGGAIPGPDGGPPPLLPLVDWRTLARAPMPDEAFGPLPGDAGDPATIAAAAEIGLKGAYPALRMDALLLMPAARLSRSALRAVHCRATDPVSFALLDGAGEASFPQLAGWSADDTARRGVAEHAAALSRIGSDARRSGQDLGTLFTAARAGIFLDSVASGDPELPLTVAATARALATRLPHVEAAVDEAEGRYREFCRTWRAPDPRAVTALRQVVGELPAYA